MKQLLNSTHQTWSLFFIQNVPRWCGHDHVGHDVKDVDDVVAWPKTFFRKFIWFVDNWFRIGWSFHLLNIYFIIYKFVFDLEKDRKTRRWECTEV